MRTKPQLLSIFRSSRSAMFFKIGILKNFSNFTANHLCWSLFLIKLQAIRRFFTENLRWLLLEFARMFFEWLDIQNFFIYNAYLVIWKVFTILGNFFKIHFLKNFTTLSRIWRYPVYCLTNVQMASLYRSDSCRLI